MDTDMLRSRAAQLVLAYSLGLLTSIVLHSCIPAAHARDDGRFSNSPLKSWFDRLASQKGLCCSFADGRRVEDLDWGTEPVAGADGKSEIRYWVRVDGVKIDVPPEAVVTEPNKYGAAVVWPYIDGDGSTKIRCFIPGSGA